MGYWENFEKLLQKKIIPNNLYHYTSIEGVKGIISEKTIWASHILCLNDTQEIWQILDNINNGYLEKVEELTNRNYRKEKYEILKHHVKDVLKDIDIFIVSFTENKDDLNLWRGYGLSNPSFALKYSKKYLLRMLNKTDADLIKDFIEKGKIFSADGKIDGDIRVISQCLYSTSEMNVILEEFKKDYILRSNKDDTFKIAARMIALLAPFIKNQAFKDENEWRMVIFRKRNINFKNSENKVMFRTHLSSIIPYILIKAENMLPDEIIIGPCSDYDYVKDNIELFLSSNCKTKITPSAIPFRNW